jgi:hypothetical protein
MRFAILPLLLAAVASATGSKSDASVQSHEGKDTPIIWSQFSTAVRASNLDRFLMHGNVSYMEEKEYFTDSGTDREHLSSTTAYEFNDSGYLTLEWVVTGKLQGKKECYFYEDGSQWLLGKSYNRYRGESCTDSIVNQYDEQGRLLRQSSYYSNHGWKLLLTSHFSYGANGWLLGECMINDVGDTIRLRLLEYDDQGNQVKETLKRPEGQPQDLHSSTTWTQYDVQGRHLRDSTVYVHGDLHLTQYSYNEHGFYSEIRRTQTDPQGVTSLVTTTFQYKYDTQGNWVERQEFQNNHLHCRLERQILYR